MHTDGPMQLLAGGLDLWHNRPVRVSPASIKGGSVAAAGSVPRAPPFEHPCSVLGSGRQDGRYRRICGISQWCIVWSIGVLSLAGEGVELTRYLRRRSPSRAVVHSRVFPCSATPDHFRIIQMFKEGMASQFKVQGRESPPHSGEEVETGVSMLYVMHVGGHGAFYRLPCLVLAFVFGRAGYVFSSGDDHRKHYKQIGVGAGFVSRRRR